MLMERTSYRPKPGKFDAVLQTRFRACEVRKAIGLRSGRVYVEEPLAARPEGGAERIVLWELDFADRAAQEADLAARAASPEFNTVRGEIGALIDGFSRALIHPFDLPGSALRATRLDGVPIVPSEVSFPSDGIDLKGYLYLPRGKGPFPCVIFNHGSSIEQGSTDICRPGTAAVLMQWGLAVMMPHRRGYGNSPGTPWRVEVDAEFGTARYDSQLAARLAAEARDVVAARDHVAGLAGIDGGRIAVMGSSFGGTVTLLAAAAEPRFRCAVDFAGAAINWEKTPGLRQLMHDAAARLTQPIFLAQAENDYSTRPTVELAAGLAGTGRVVAHRVYPGFGLTRDEGHFLCGQGAAVWRADVRDFLERWL